MPYQSNAFWSAQAWADIVVPILCERWPGMVYRPAGEYEDKQQAVDYHVALEPGRRERRLQWRGCEWAGYATFTRRDLKTSGADTEADKLVAGAPVEIWVQAYLTPGPRQGPAERCVCLAVASAQVLMDCWEIFGWSKENRQDGTHFRAVKFADVVPRLEWRPDSGWTFQTRRQVGAA